VAAAPNRTRHDVSGIRQRLLRIARYAWAGPCTLVGLALTLPVVFRGGAVRVRSGVLTAAPPESARTPWFPYVAITFGHVVLARSERILDEVFAHELEHVRQYERWGAAFFLAYPTASLLQVLRGERPYWTNHFEVQARQRSARAGRVVGEPTDAARG